MRRSVKQVALIPENFLRAVAMMDIEIDDSDALGPMFRARVLGGNGGVGEQAKALDRIGFSMVAGRAGGAKGVCGFAGHDLVNCRGGRAAGPQGCLKAAMRHRRVTVQHHARAVRRRRLCLADGVNIGRRMHPLDHRHVSQWGVLPHKAGKARNAECGLNRTQPIRPLRMAWARIMEEAGSV